MSDLDLREVIEDLWANIGYPGDLQPETIEFCKANHEALCHGGEVEDLHPEIQP